MSTSQTWTLEGPEQTQAFGRALGELMRAGDFLALIGPLGAGKTQFVKGLAAGLGVPAEEPVVSPTFVLVREYVGRLTLYHIDAYRLSGSSELLSLGLEEMAGDPEGVVAVEWADRVPDVIPEGACRVSLEHVAEDVRSASIDWADRERLATLLGRIGR